MYNMMYFVIGGRINESFEKNREKLKSEER